MFQANLLLLPLLFGNGDESERLSIYANGRMRAESTFEQLSGEDRHCGRMRGRIGAKYLLTEGLTAEARISTASDGRDPNNPHWDFGDGEETFEGADIVLDRLFLDFDMGEYGVRVGKMPDAFRRPPVLSEFIWDNDIQPSGASASWLLDVNEKVAVDLRIAEYIAVENGSDDDSTMFGVQAGVDVDVSDGCDVTAAVSYSQWSGLNAGAAEIDNQGNTDPTGDFDIDFKAL